MTRRGNRRSRVAALAFALAGWSLAPASGAVAKMGEWNGAPAMMVDGKPVPPMMMTMTEFEIDDRDRAYFRRLGETGFRVFYLTVKTDWLNPPDPGKGEIGGVERAKRAMKLVAEEVPGAYFMLRLVASPPVSWVNAHPEEQVLYSDGTHRRTHCSTCSHTEPIDGMFSLFSEKWRVRASEEIAKFLAGVKGIPEYGRVIGVFLGAGSTSEWGHSQVMHMPDGAYGDFSEPCRAEFERFLREKYGTVENLRRAWRRPDAAFERPPIPTPAEKEYELGADERIALALTYREGSVAAELPKLDVDARGPFNKGTFLNADRCQHVRDFYAAWHLGTANTILRFARAVKASDPNLLVGAFYGGLGCCNYHDGGTSYGTLRLIDSDLVDFLATPCTYENREPGGATAMRAIQDSFRLRGKLFVNEDDCRTHLSDGEGAWSRHGLFDAEDAVGTLKRDFGRVLCTDVHAWWFDMGGNNWNMKRPYWYDDPALLATMKRQQETFRAAYGRDRTKRNEIALVIDLDSLHCVSRFTNRIPLDYYRVTDLCRVGAPMDVYAHKDLSNPKMPDYRLYFMLNPYCLTDADRDAIYAKARRNGATILWMYAPGYVNPDAGKRMDVAHVSRTVGMEVKEIDGTFVPYFRVNPKSHPLVARASGAHRYGTLDREVHGLYADSERFVPKYVNPGFYVDDPRVTVLGRFCRTSTPGDPRKLKSVGPMTALAAVKTNGVTSVYCAAPVMRSDLVASIAAGSGCHVYTARADVFYANEQFVSLHATGDGRRTIRFKKRCSPYEVYEKRYFARDVELLDLDMKNGQTHTWYVGDGPVF